MKKPKIPFPSFPMNLYPSALTATGKKGIRWKNGNGSIPSLHFPIPLFPQAFKVLIVVFMLILPGRSRAFLDLGQGDWLSGQNSLLVELLATEVEELANITETLRNIRVVAQAGNEALAVARSAYREYRAVRNYSREDLIRDAKRGLYKAFPDMKGIENEIVMYEDQVEAGSAFWSYHGAHDRNISRATQRVLEHNYQATIWPTVFPEAMVYRRNPSPVDLHIWGLYCKTGQRAAEAVRKTALAALAAKAANFVADAEESKNLELAAQAAINQLLVQEVHNSTEFIELYRTEMALGEAAMEADRSARRTVSKSLSSRARIMFGPGAMFRE